MKEYQIRLKDSYMYSEIKLFGVKLSKYKVSKVSESTYASISRVLGVNLATVHIQEEEKKDVASTPSTPLAIEPLESDSKNIPFIDAIEGDKAINPPADGSVSGAADGQGTIADQDPPEDTKDGEAGASSSEVGSTKKRGRKSTKSSEAK